MSSNNERTNNTSEAGPSNANNQDGNGNGNNQTANANDRPDIRLIPNILMGLHHLPEGHVIQPIRTDPRRRREFSFLARIALDVRLSTRGTQQAAWVRHTIRTVGPPVPDAPGQRLIPVDQATLDENGAEGPLVIREVDLAVRRVPPPAADDQPAPPPLATNWQVPPPPPNMQVLSTLAPAADVFQSINLTLDPSLSDYSRRLRNGEVMMEQAQYIQRMIQRLEEVALYVLLAHNTPWRVNAPEQGAAVHGRILLQMLGWDLRVGSRDEDRRFIFLLDPTLPDFGRRVVEGRVLILRVQWLSAIMRIFENTMRETLLPENTPWTTAIPAQDVACQDRFLYLYGRFLRVGTRFNDGREAHNANLQQFGNRFYDLDHRTPEAFIPAMNTFLVEATNRNPQDAVQWLLREMPWPPGAVGPPRDRGSRPASVASIESIVKTTYEQSNGDEKVEGQDCPICLEPFEGEDHIAHMPCGHVYHQTCLEFWLKTRNSCPTCRGKVPEPKHEPKKYGDGDTGTAGATI